ncbi:hypothetical protein CEP54_014272 [Fusarium duplospermum]|uniref:Uncharacterized protein n=1 Tax=Fusarium duplospermum TaxID=1325734 RepID=A0A428NXA1_9HYPO|nr:hypothetical protein CEP54_014272 [Fusarium duplospermum]
MTPLNPNLASQASLGVNAVRGGMLGAIHIVRKREDKPKKTRAPASSSSDRVTKKKGGKRTAAAAVQTAPAVPQGTAVPSSSFVSGFPQGTAPPPFAPAPPQGIQTPLFSRPLPPLPASCLPDGGQTSGFPSVTGSDQTQFLPSLPPQPQYVNGFFEVGNQPHAAGALIPPPPSQPPMQPNGCFIPRSQPNFQAGLGALPAPSVPLPDVGTGSIDMLNIDTTDFSDVNFFDDVNIDDIPIPALPAIPQVSLPPTQDLAPVQDLPALPSQDLAPVQDLPALPSQDLAPPQNLSTLPQGHFDLLRFITPPDELPASSQGLLAPPSQDLLALSHLPTPPNDLPPPSNDLPSTTQDLPAPSNDIPSLAQDLPAAPLPESPVSEPTSGVLSNEQWYDVLKALNDDADFNAWIILRILNDEDRFAKVVTFTLRLTRQQIQEFLEIYLREEYAWRVWEEYVVKIPHMPLLEHALEKRITVPALLHFNRPPLLTDNITFEDEERGVLFLQEKRMHDFLPLRIEWEIFQDGIDKQIIHQSVELGWAKPELLKTRPAAPAPDVSADDSSLGHQERYAPLFGSVGRRLPLHRKEGGGSYDLNEVNDLNEDYDSEQTQDDDDKTISPDKADRAAPEQPKNQPSITPTTPNQPTTNNRDVILPTPEPLPPIPFLPGPYGFQPCQGQERFLHEAFCRRHRRAYRYVPGCFTHSLEEEGRDWLPHREACWPRGPYVELGPRNLQAYADIIVECARHDFDATGRMPTQGMPSVGHRSAMNGRQTVTNGRVHQYEAATAHHENNSHQDGPYQGSAENLSSPVWHSGSYDAYTDSRMAVEGDDQRSENGSFIDEEKTDTEMFVTPTASTLPEYRTAMLGGFPNTNTPQDLSELAPSAQLRHHLDTNFSHYLTKKSSTARKSSTSQNRSRKKQSSSEILAEDWEGGYDVVLPEAEKDTAYCPKRGDRKKRSRKATDGGRQKKSIVKDMEKKNSEMIAMEGDGEEGPKGGHSALKANKESNSDFTEAQGIAIKETPVQKELVNNTNNGPASSGRIKIVLKSSSHTPTSPAENTTKSNSPIFGVDRNSIVASTRERVQMAHYAWSAEEATFASISTHARFAQTADHIVKPPSMGKMVSVDMAAETIELQRLQTAFENIEGAQKGQGAQDAERAEFAGCADRAMYAVQAETACFAVEVKDMDGDCEMKDVE